MADPIAQDPGDFQTAFDELIQALVDDGASPEEAVQVAKQAVSQAPPRRDAYTPKVGAGAYGLPYMPPLAPNRLADDADPAGEVVDSFMTATGLPSSLRTPVDIAYRVGEWGPRQVKKADQAIDRAIREPSVGSIANAGTQTGMAALRPAIALPSLAVQYGDALSRDLGLFDSSAQAQAPLLRKQQRELEMERQRSEIDRQRRREQADQDAQIARERAAQEGEVRRQEAETAARLKLEEAEAARQRELKTETARKDRAEYDRAVERADAARLAELSKQKVFKDTAVGKVWDDTGGVTPFLLGAGSGFLQRGINPAVSHGKVLGFGAAGGAAATNVPLGADAYLVPPVENPEKRALEAYARELPPTHPRKAEFTGYATDERVPRFNPARSEAERQLYDTWPMIKRNVFGAIEGAVGAEGGYGLWHIPARFFNALGGGAKAAASRLLPGGSLPPTGGGVPPGTPSGRNALAETTASPPGAGPTPPAPSGGTEVRPRLADRVREGQSRVPEALPSPQSSLPSWASEPPAGVTLPKDVHWDRVRNQPRHKDGTYVEMPKYRHPK